MDSLLSRMDEQISLADLREREILTFQKAQVFEISGQIEAALTLYRQMWIEFDDPQYQLKYLQLSYETGDWTILSEVSEALLHSEGAIQISLVVLETRILMSQGYWDRAVNLLNSYRSKGMGSPEYLYLYYYLYRAMGELDRSSWAQTMLSSHFPQSPEYQILAGQAVEIVKPSLLALPFPPSNESYFFQVAALQNREGAMLLKSQIESRGLDVRILQEGGFYKLLVSSDTPQDEEITDLLEELDLKPFRVQF